jgi:hypothetical protein
MAFTHPIIDRIKDEPDQAKKLDRLMFELPAGAEEEFILEDEKGDFYRIVLSKSGSRWSDKVISEREKDRQR